MGDCRTIRIANTILLFDVDGTLTESTKMIKPEMYEFLLHEVKSLVPIGIVSGAKFGQILMQMGDKNVHYELEYIFSENGVIVHKHGTLVGAQFIQDHINSHVLQKFINFALNYMSKLELPVKRGTFIEFRNATINVCPAGRSCSDEERAQFIKFDKVHKIRERFIEALMKEFPDSGLTFALGGETSFDVYPTAWNKTQCLQYLSDYDVIHFFGDHCLPGGNDHELYEHKDVIGHHVKSPEDTMKQVRLVLRDLIM